MTDQTVHVVVTVTAGVVTEIDVFENGIEADAEQTHREIETDGNPETDVYRFEEPVQ